MYHRQLSLASHEQKFIHGVNFGDRVLFKAEFGRWPAVADCFHSLNHFKIIFEHFIVITLFSWQSLRALSHCCCLTISFILRLERAGRHLSQAHLDLLSFFAELSCYILERALPFPLGNYDLPPSFSLTFSKSASAFQPFLNCLLPLYLAFLLI